MKVRVYWTHDYHETREVETRYGIVVGYTEQSAIIIREQATGGIVAGSHVQGTNFSYAIVPVSRLKISSVEF